MSDPKRLVDEGRELLPEARRLLRAGSELMPPAGAVDRGWSDFLALNGIPPTGSGGDGGGAGPAAGPSHGSGLSSGGGGLGAAGALPLASVVKTFSFGAALGVAAVLGVQGASSLSRPSDGTAAPPPVAAGREPASIETSTPVRVRAPSPFPVAEAAPAAPAPTTGGATPSVARAAEPSLPSPVEATEPPAPGSSVASFPLDAAARESLLRAEARDIAEARAMIAAGRASEALVFLGRSSERFKDGTLGQEREVLIIEALAGSGQTAAAKERADDFSSRHPRSPLLERVRRAGK